MKPNTLSTDKGQRKFAAWFKEQYGTMPSEIRRQRLRKKKDELKAAYEDALLWYRAEDNLHATWRDALYGWNAKR